MKNRLFIVLLICLPSVVLDQWSKQWATQNLKHLTQPLSYFDNLVRLQYALNPGAWGGMGGMLPETMRKIVFTVLVGIFLLILTWYILSKEHPKLLTIGLSLILAGGLGNLIDRAMYGYVVDFMYIGYDPISWLHTNIFNVADMAIMAGGAILLILAFPASDKSASKSVKASHDNPDESEAKPESSHA